MIKLTLFFLATFMVGMLFLFVTGDCRLSRNVHSAVTDGAQSAWKVTAGRAETRVQRIGYQIRYSMENTADILRAGAGALSQGALDASISAAVKMKLANDDAVTASQIHVDTHDGAVTLRGTASTQTEVDTAIRIASGVEGVNRVVSQLQIRS